MSTANTVHQTIATIATQVATFLVSTAIGILVTRVLGPDGKGFYFLAISLTTLIFVFIKSSIEVAGTYYVGKKEYGVNQLPAHYLFSSLLMTVVAYLALALGWRHLEAWLFPNLPLIYAVIALLALPANLVILYFASILMIPNKVAKYNRIFIFQNLVSTILLVFFIFVLRSGALGAIIAWTITLWIAALYSIYVVRSEIGIPLTVKASFLRKLFSFGLKGHIGEITDYFIDRTDAFLVNYFLGITNVGYYSIALMAELLWYIPNSIIAILYPKFSAGGHDTLGLAMQACRITLFVTAIPGLLLMLLAKPLVLIAFGPSFAPAIAPLVIAVPGIVSLSISKCLKIYLSSQGLPLPASYASLIAYAVNLSLNIVIIPRYGLSGAAAVGSISYILYALIIFGQFSWRYNASFVDTIFIKVADIRMITAMLLRRTETKMI